MPEVTVVIPAYNAADTIAFAIASVEAQTFRDFEIIVADDGSHDATVDVARRASSSARILSGTNAGPGAARNRAIAVAAGRIICFLDADDLWLPEKLEEQVTYFRRYPETGLLHTGVINIPVDHDRAFRPARSTFAPPVRAFCELFHVDVTVGTTTAAVPRAALLEAGGFDERREVHVEDWDLWLRIASKHPVGFLERVLAIHQAGGIMSSAVEKTFRGQEIVVRKNMALCAAACARHRASPSACLDRRLYMLNLERGREYMRRDDMAAARGSFRTAARYQPYAPAPRLLWVFSLADEISGGVLRRGKRAAARLGRRLGSASGKKDAIERTGDGLTLRLEGLAKGDLTQLRPGSLRLVQHVEIELYGPAQTPSMLAAIFHELWQANFTIDMSVLPADRSKHDCAATLIVTADNPAKSSADAVVHHRAM